MNPTDSPRRTARALTWLRAWGGALVVGGALATVAVVAGFISYTHICALTLQLDQSWKTAHLMPLAVDGQIIIGGAVLAADRPGRWWGLVGALPGLGESLVANWESGIAHGYFAAAAALVAAQAFAASSFLFERWLRSRVSARGQHGTARPATVEEAVAALLETGSRRVLAASLGIEPSHLQRWERWVAADAPELALNGSGPHA